LLRDDLRYVQQQYGLTELILIGHSMGGILSRMQVTNSGREIWNEQFKANADKLYAEIPDDSIVKRALIFNANPAVKRVIFVSTPHRGSDLATGGIGALGMRLIRLPFKVVSAIPKSVEAAIAPNTDPKKYQLPTSISGLSPSNPIYKAMDKLPIEAPHNSIIGDRGRGDTPNSSDGVVPYWSSHLNSAQSEVIVPTDHGAMKSPKAVAEIHRILLLQAGQKSSQRTVTKQE
jgi:pimeloyl-ACP methyl ester carboxylesterase